MEAIVLVGGLGTRLGELTKNTPKPMLPIRGVPFLERLLAHLKSQGFRRVILAVGYKREVVESYFCDLKSDLPDIAYSIENTPLGTGGAIAQALASVTSSSVFVLNGDSFLDVDYKAMQQQHTNTKADITIASYFIKPADRYGVLKVSDSCEVINFQEKGAVSEGLINGGVYIIDVARLNGIFDMLNKNTFSFEESVLSNASPNLKKYHLQTSGYFLDIGIPEDYEKAQQELFV
jgi:D-glycero-alpha-D-manno-heptose 1-phosphate guanylyltransferase